MTITSFVELLDNALRGKYAIGYFESWDQYSLEAAMEAAEECQSPAILGFGGAVTNQAWMEAGGVEALGALARVLATRSSVPTAVLFNEARTVDQLRRGILSGCNAVMLDASHLPFSDNLTQTKRITDMAHPLGAAVEAELGHLADATDARVQALGTDPDEAAAFVADTGIDALAVSIGNVHIMSSGVATIDLDLLERIHLAVQVPLVIHGGTGFPADAVRAVIARGVAKFNVGTRLKATYLQGIREAAQALSGNENIHTVMGSRDATDVLQCGKENLKQEIKRFIRLYGSEGKAA